MYMLIQSMKAIGGCKRFNFILRLAQKEIVCYIYYRQVVGMSGKCLKKKGMQYSFFS